jgi:Asp-tRNA(Asn)/Glu-tRNA(Gln) amidotransferase A subunit family amidase
VSDATAMAEDVRARRVSPVELVEEALAAIEERDSEINAFTVVLADEARERAREVEREPIGPLAGVPIAIKDHVWMRGAPATNGSLALRDFYPDVDAACVARLREAGAVIVGKTNNPEFCYRGITDNAVYGLTRNPRKLDRTPGGSSGGSAAAVAADMVPFALGTDGGGSIRIPASFCGIAGLKPTFGLIPKLPGFRGWPTLSVDGPLARTVRDLALTLGVMAGASPVDDLTWPVPLNEREAPRVAYSQDLGFAPVEPSVRQAFGNAIAKLDWNLEEAHPPPISPTPLWNAVALPEGYASEGPLLAEHEHQLTAGTAEIVRAGAGTSAAEYLDAQHERSLYTRAWAEFFDDYDLLLIPTMQLTAFPVGMLSPPFIDGRPIDQFFDDWCTLCIPANLTGQPAASVPIGTDEDGLPIGLQIIGRRWEDLTVLAAAAAVERLALLPHR